MPAEAIGQDCLAVADEDRRSDRTQPGANASTDLGEHRRVVVSRLAHLQDVDRRVVHVGGPFVGLARREERERTETGGSGLPPHSVVNSPGEIRQQCEPPAHRRRQSDPAGASGQMNEAVDGTAAARPPGGLSRNQPSLERSQRIVRRARGLNTEAHIFLDPAQIAGRQMAERDSVKRARDRQRPAIPLGPIARAGRMRDGGADVSATDGDPRPQTVQGDGGVRVVRHARRVEHRIGFAVVATPEQASGETCSGACDEHRAPCRTGRGHRPSQDRFGFVQPAIVEQGVAGGNARFVKQGLVATADRVRTSFRKGVVRFSSPSAPKERRRQAHLPAGGMKPVVPAREAANNRTQAALARRMPAVCDQRQYLGQPRPQGCHVGRRGPDSARGRRDRCELRSRFAIRRRALRGDPARSVVCRRRA